MRERQQQKPRQKRRDKATIVSLSLSDTKYKLQRTLPAVGDYPGCLLASFLYGILLLTWWGPSSLFPHTQESFRLSTQGGRSEQAIQQHQRTPRLQITATRGGGGSSSSTLAGWPACLQTKGTEENFEAEEGEGEGGGGVGGARWGSAKGGWAS